MTVSTFSVPQGKRIISVTRLIESRGRNRLGVRRDYVSRTLSASSGDVFPVIVKHNGDDGDGNPLYDLYNQTDSGYATTLNLSGPVAPKNSRARIIGALVVNGQIQAPTDGSHGLAYIDGAGDIQLDGCPETILACI